MSQLRKSSLGGQSDPKRTDDSIEPSVVPIRESDVLESTIPPTPLRDLLAADGASVFVYSKDDALLAIVQEAGGEQYPVYPASSWQALREAIVERRCGIALLDIDTVSGALSDRIAELAQLNSGLVLLVASERDGADGLLTLLSQRRIHRLLIKPPTVGITRLLLESSVNRHIELKRRADMQQAPTRTSQPPTRFAGWRSWVLAGAMVFGAVGVAIYFTVGDEPARNAVRRTVSEPLSDASLPVPTIEPAAAEIRMDLSPTVSPGGAPVAAEAPSLANMAASQDGPVVPPLGIAADYSSPGGVASGDEPVLSQGPDPAELEEQYAAIEAALLSDDLDVADELLAELDVLDPDSTRAVFLSSQLERARVRAAEVAEAQAAAALAAEAAAAPSELSSLIGLARARLAQGQVLDPPGDNAFEYYERARSIGGNAPELGALQTELATAVLTAAEVELAEDRFAAAEDLFLTARDLGVGDADLAGLELGLALARETLAREAENALLATAMERLAAGRVFDPPNESALDAVLELRRRNSDHPGLPDAFADIRAALEPAATAALDAGNWARAASVIDALAQAEAPVAVVAELRDELTFRERQAAYLAESAPASELSVLEFAAPEYPNRAITRGEEGWVDLEFVVDREGLPRDIAVIGAEPAELFESAAVEAAQQYVFVPFEIDDRVYERRVQLRIRFALQ